MSILSVYHLSSTQMPNKVLTHFEDIASTLAEQGVVFERWQASVPVSPGDSAEEVISAYGGHIDPLMGAHGLVSVDVISVRRDTPQASALRAGLLAEQFHAAGSVRLFIAGRGLLNLHIGEFVYAVLCERNDSLRIPAGVLHWIDIGREPHLVAVGLFGHSQGWIAEPIASGIADQFPELDD